MAPPRGEVHRNIALENEERNLTIRVTYSTKEISLDTTFSGITPDAVVAAMQKEAAGQVGFAMKLIVNSMSALQFAREVIKRYNEATGRSLPSPGSSLEFIRLGEREGIIKVIQP